MFRGRFEHAIDDKGRLSIPSRFREVLAKRRERVLVLAAFDACLAAFPLKEWNLLEEQIRKQGMFRKEIRDFMRVFYSAATESALDAQGRILIPPALRERAALDREVVLAGLMNRIEIWDRAAWQRLERERGGSFEEIAAKLGELGL